MCIRDRPYITSIWSEGIIKWTSMSAYLPLCSLAGAMAYWRARKLSLIHISVSYL